MSINRQKTLVSRVMKPTLSRVEGCARVRMDDAAVSCLSAALEGQVVLQEDRRGV